MATYDGAEAVYDELGGVLRRVLADPARLARLQSADAIVRFDLHEPDAKLTCLARVGAPGVLATGETDVKPDLVLAMEADLLRGLMFGERTPLTALVAGEIALKGPAAKLLRVMEALVGASDAVADAEASATASEAGSSASAELPADGSDAASDAVASEAGSSASAELPADGEPEPPADGEPESSDAPGPEAGGPQPDDASS